MNHFGSFFHLVKGVVLNPSEYFPKAFDFDYKKALLYFFLPVSFSAFLSIYLQSLLYLGELFYYGEWNLEPVLILYAYYVVLSYISVFVFALVSSGLGNFYFKKKAFDKVVSMVVLVSTPMLFIMCGLLFLRFSIEFWEGPLVYFLKVLFLLLILFIVLYYVFLVVRGFSLLYQISKFKAFLLYLVSYLIQMLAVFVLVLVLA